MVQLSMLPAQAMERPTPEFPEIVELNRVVVAGYNKDAPIRIPAPVFPETVQSVIEAFGRKTPRSPGRWIWKTEIPPPLLFLTVLRMATSSALDTPKVGLEETTHSTRRNLVAKMSALERTHLLRVSKPVGLHTGGSSLLQLVPESMPPSA